MSAPHDRARATLLRALEEFDAALGELDILPDRIDLCVVYSIGAEQEDGSFHEIGGWASTSAPQWAHAALLRRAADGLDEDARDTDTADDE